MGAWPAVSVKAVTWNAATVAYSACGGVASATISARKKFADVRKLCNQHDVVLLQETPGCALDLKLWELEITTHIFVGTFMDGVGGTVVGLRREWLGPHPLQTQEIDKGRVLLVELVTHNGEHLRLVNVHADLGYSERRKAELWRDISNACGDSLATMLGGDLNFVEDPADRDDMMRAGADVDDLLDKTAASFASSFNSFVELRQPQFTRKRLVNVKITTPSRIGRWYVSCMEVDVLDRDIVVRVLGNLADDTLSDHIPVQLAMGTRRARPQGWPPIPRWITAQLRVLGSGARVHAALAARGIDSLRGTVRHGHDLPSCGQ